MSIKFNCPNCPTPLKAKDKQAGQEFTCAKCGHRCTVPFESLVDVDEKAIRKAKRQAREKFEFEIGMVNLGLLIHYGGLAVHLLSFWLFAAGGSALILARAIPDFRDSLADTVAVGLLTAAVVVALLAALVDYGIGAFCLKVPFKAPYILLRAWLALHFPLLCCGVWFFLALAFDWWTTPPAVTVFALALVNWGLWSAFVLLIPNAIGHYDLRDEIGSSLLHLGLGVVISFVLIFLVALTVGLMVLFRAEPVYQTAVLTSALFLALSIWGAAWHLGPEDSPLAVALYPVGVLSAARYLDTLGSLRLVIERRT